MANPFSNTAAAATPSMQAAAHQSPASAAGGAASTLSPAWQAGRTTSFPQIMPQNMSNLLGVGFAPAISAQLEQRQDSFAHYQSHGGKTPEIRVDANKTLSSASATQSFVGIGLDEHVQTRMQRKEDMSDATSSQLMDIAGSRSRTAELVWATSAGASFPIAGHTPGIKTALVGGTTGAKTSEHASRDKSRELANLATMSDSKYGMADLPVLSTLATIKYMSSPSTELSAIKSAVNQLPAPLYSALTDTGDLRDGAHFDAMVDHVQEERERKKWEAGSVLMSNPRLNSLVPNTIRAYLSFNGNNPLAAMDHFRQTQNTPGAPAVNTHLQSQTDNLSAQSLNAMANPPPNTARGRALSDARRLPAAIPPNSRGR